CSATHSAEGEPHSNPPNPKNGGCQTACGSSRLTGSVGAMQNPTFWLRTATDLFAVSSAYLANCSKCQWLWPGWLSKPMGPALTRPVGGPSPQKSWEAFLVGDPVAGDPSTSGGRLPPS